MCCRVETLRQHIQEITDSLIGDYIHPALGQHRIDQAIRDFLNVLPARVETLRQHIQEITDSVIDTVLPQGRMDVIADLANPLPATVTAELMGVPVADRDQLKEWSIDFSEMLGNFQHNPGRTSRMLQVVEEMTSYYRARMKELEHNPQAGDV